MIKIFRQYPVINGFLQVPPNKESERTKYIVGNHINDPVGTVFTATASIDASLTKVVTIKNNTEHLEFVVSQV